MQTHSLLNPLTCSWTDPFSVLRARNGEFGGFNAPRVLWSISCILNEIFFSGVCQSVAINSAFWVSDDMMKI